MVKNRGSLMVKLCRNTRNEGTKGYVYKDEKPQHRSGRCVFYELKCSMYWPGMKSPMKMLVKNVKHAKIIIGKRKIY